jgi:hypothetical protein
MLENPRIPRGENVTIYCVTIEDRHSDIEIQVFSTREKAIEVAQKFFNENRNPDHDIEELIPEPEVAKKGYEFFKTYSVEGDCVWVKALELDPL